MGAIGNEWGLAAFTALATIGASYLLVRASRRDRAQDKREKLEAQVADNTEDIAHISGHLEVKTGYRPRSK